MRHLVLLPILALLTGCNGSDIPAGDPLKKVSAESFGLQLREGKLMDRDMRVHWLQEYVTGYQAPDGNQIPASIKTFTPATSCHPQVKSGSKIAQVLTDHSTAYAPLYGLDATQLKRLGQNLTAIVSVKSTPNLFFSKTEGKFDRIDVIVTDTSAPLHLVFAARNVTLWNIIKAKNADISGVTLVSEGHAAAIANLDPGVPVSAIVGEVAKRCHALPAVAPVKNYPGIRMQLHKANNNDKKWADMTSAYNAYNRFFKSAFGVSSDEVSVGTSALTHAAIGPLPSDLDARLPYRSLEKAEIRASALPYLVYGTKQQNRAARREAAIAAASKVAGGDFRSILEEMGY